MVLMGFGSTLLLDTVGQKFAILYLRTDPTELMNGSFACQEDYEIFDLVYTLEDAEGVI